LASHCCVNRPADGRPEGQDRDLFWNMSDGQVGDKSESCAGGDEFELGCEVDGVGDGSGFEAGEPACPADHRAAGQVNRCGDPIAVGELFECDGRPSRGERVVENGVGTNPEELIAAAHAGCFTMAFSGQLTTAGFIPDSIETTAVLTLDVHAAPTITKIHLTTKAKVPGATKEKFAELAHNAEVGCPVSKVLKAAEITLDATLL